MTQEKLREVLTLAAQLYPGEFLNPEKVHLWRSTLEPRNDPDFILDQLRIFAAKSKWGSLPEFANHLAVAEKSQRTARGHAERLDKEISDAARRQGQRDAERRQVEIDRTAAVQMITALPESERERLREELIGQYPTFAKRWATADPIKTPVLCALMAERARMEVPA